MSSSIEDRVVKISFDNASFQRKTSDTIKKLAELDKSIADVGKKNGLAEIAKADKKFKLSGMTKSIEDVSKSFLALSTVAITALSNITNRAVDAGLALAKSLTLEPIMQGFQEYELNINSIQTILANTKKDGTNLQDVNAALDELNEYADKTIYNFAQMTQNIGAFTAQGIDLQTATAAIKGISNAAAIAGSNSQQAGNAMYNLAQAIGEGSLRLQNWNSVVNAGMGGEVMQNALFQTGKALGTLGDIDIDTTFEEWQEAGNNFRNSLQEGWITAEVLTTTLQGFSGDFDEAELAAMGFTETMIQEFRELGQLGVESATTVRTLTQLMDTAREAVGSGWMETFRIVIGDFEEASALFTALSEAFGDIVGKQADARNQRLKEWKALGGRDNLLEGLRASASALSNVFGALRDSFRAVFPKKTGVELAVLTAKFRDFALRVEAFTESDSMDKIRRLFTGLFNVLKVGGAAIKAVVKGFYNLFTAFVPISTGGLLDGLAEFGDLLADISATKVSNAILGFFDDLEGYIRNLPETLSKVWESVKEFFSGFDISMPSFGLDFGAFDDFDLPDFSFDFLGPMVERFEFLSDLTGGVVDFFKSVGSAIADFWNGISEAASGISGFFSDVGEAAAEGMDDRTFEPVADAASVGLTGAISYGIWKFLNDGLKINFGQLDLAENITDILEGLNGVLKAMQADLKAQALLKIAGALGVLTISIVALSMIDSVALTKALTAIAVGFAQLAGAFAIISKMEFGPADSAKMVALSLSMTILAGGIVLLSFAVAKLGNLDTDELRRGLIGVATAMGIMLLAMKGFESMDGLTGAGMKITGIALGLIALSIPIKIFAGMSWPEIERGLTTTAAGLAMVIGSMHLMPDGTGQAAILIGFGAGLLLMSGAMTIMARLSWEDLAKGLLGVAGGMTTLVVAINYMPTGQLAAGAGTILAFSGAMVIMSIGLERLAKLGWEDLAKGIIGTIGVMYSLSIALKAMKDTEKASLSTLLMSLALGQLVKVVRIFAELPIPVLVKGVLSIIGVVYGLAAAAWFGQAAAAPMLTMAGAIAAFGVGMLLVGAAAAQFAKALLTLSKIGPEAMGTVKVALDMMIAALPRAAVALGEAVVAFVVTLASMSGEIANAFIQLGTDMLLGLTELIPVAGELLQTLITELVELIIENATPLAEAGFTLLLALATGVRDNITELATLALEIVAGLIDGLTAGLPTLVDSVVNFLTTAFTTVAGQVGFLMPTLTVDIGIAFINGLIAGLTQSVGKLWDWITSLPGKILDLIKAGLGISSPSTKMMAIGVDLMLGLLNGVVEGFVAVLEWFGEIAATILGYFVDALSWLFDAGWDILTGLYDGIIEGATAVWDFYAEIYTTIFGYFADALTWLYDSGKDILQGLRDGIDAIWDQLKTWLETFSEKISGYFTGALLWLYDSGKDVLQGLRDGIDEVWDLIRIFFENIPTKIKEWLGGAADWLFNIGKDILNGLKRGAEAALDGVKDFFTGIGTSIVSWKGPPEYDAIMLVGNGKLIMQGLLTGLKSELPEVKEFFMNIAPEDDVEADEGSLQESGEKVMLGFLDGMKSGEEDVIEYLRNFDPSEHLNPNLAQAFAQKIKGALDEAFDQAQTEASSSGGGSSAPVSSASKPKTLRETLTPAQLKVVEESERTRNIVASDEEIREILEAAKVPVDPTNGANFINGASVVKASEAAKVAEASSLAQQNTPEGNIIFNQVINSPEPVGAVAVHRATSSQIAAAEDNLRQAKRV